MAFCNKCGNQLVGNEKFCAQCGATVGAASSAASVTPVPGPSGAVRPATQPMASPPNLPPTMPPVQPVQYAPMGPGQVAVAYPPPPVAPTNKSGGIVGTVIVVLIAGAIGLYFYNKSHITPAPTPAPTPTPVVSQPGASTPPPAPGTGGNKALAQQQDLSAQWQALNGFIVVPAKWTNNSNVNMTAAEMECDQYDNQGTELSQFRKTLDGPTPPNTWSSYSNVQMGEAAAGVSKLNCGIVHVTPAS